MNISFVLFIIFYVENVKLILFIFNLLIEINVGHVHLLQSSNNRYNQVFDFV